MRVLVLCHGNINRSAFVAGILQQHRPNWRVASAGLKTRDGRPASPKARSAAKALGFSLDEHRSTVVTADMIEAADVVLYMDGGNEKRLRQLHTLPGAADWAALPVKCKLLAKYGSLRRIPDPNYTSDPEKLREFFGIAATCTMKFLEAHP